MQPTNLDETPSLPTIIEDAYTRLKLLSLSDQVPAAERLFVQTDMMNYWEPLLQHTLMRKNCAITKLILKCIIASGKFGYEELQKKVSTMTHRVAFEFAETARFAHRVNKYMDSDEYLQDSVKSEEVFKTAHRILKSRTGKEIVSPSKFIISAASAATSS